MNSTVTLQSILNDVVRDMVPKLETKIRVNQVVKTQLSNRSDVINSLRFLKERAGFNFQCMIELVDCSYDQFCHNNHKRSQSDDNGCDRDKSVFGWYNPKTQEFWFSWNNPVFLGCSNTLRWAMDSYLDVDIPEGVDAPFKRYYHASNVLTFITDLLFQLSVAIFNRSKLTHLPK